MKLLIVTQAVDANDPVLGFFVHWIEEFAKHFERIEVIALRVGKYDLPGNVRVHSLGKENKPPRFARRLLYILRFKRLVWKLRHDYDAVFVHMNPEYLALAGWWWRITRKRVVLWYAHRAVTLKLRVAARFADVIATTSASSFNLNSHKVHVLGHGIDTAFFRNPHKRSVPHSPLEIICVGRLTPIKDQRTVVEALALLRERDVDVRLTLIGAPVRAGDSAYEHEVKELVAKRGLEDRVAFVGAVTYDNMPRQYAEHDISVNLCPTGGLDKVVFESMAASVPAIVANRGFKKYLGSYAERLSFLHGDSHDLAEKISALIRAPDFAQVGSDLAETARREADVSILVTALAKLLS